MMSYMPISRFSHFLKRSNIWLRLWRLSGFGMNLDLVWGRARDTNQYDITSIFLS